MAAQESSSFVLFRQYIQSEWAGARVWQVQQGSGLGLKAFAIYSGCCVLFYAIWRGLQDPKSR
eukprot:11175985-Lingulodinium_polyedra.AAC.1